MVPGRKSGAVTLSKEGKKKAVKKANSSGELGETQPLTEEEKEAAKAAKKARRTREPGDESERTSNVYDWSTNFNALLVYRVQVGNCYVSQKAIFECDLPGLGEGGSDLHYVGRLGKWLDNQRQFKKNNKLPADREAMLQELVDQGMYVCISSLYMYLYVC